jgi:hypothetical protein
MPTNNVDSSGTAREHHAFGRELAKVPRPPRHHAALFDEPASSAMITTMLVCALASSSSE